MQLACNDVVPGLGWDFVAQGDSASEVHAAMLAHGDLVHSVLMEGMTVDDIGRAKEETDNRIFGLLSAAS